MAQQPYHKYVFDQKKRKFVGKFEEMYANEEKENFDSWFQEDLNHFVKQLTIIILKRYDFVSILDIGCGKGAFTQLLKKPDNRVTAVDISSTAISKAKSRYKDIDFKVSDAFTAINSGEHYELIVMMEILSYLEDWRRLIKESSEKTKWLYITLFLPPDPIGFVKNFNGLKDEVKKFFEIETELLWNNEHILLLSKSKNSNFKIKERRKI